MKQMKYIRKGYIVSKLVFLRGAYRSLDNDMSGSSCLHPLYFFEGMVIQ